jgi:CRP-like cAMP-binding protein
MAPEAQPSRICPAMLEAGILDPNSQKGIDFCTDKCPYDRCIVFESTLGIRKHKVRATEANRLKAQGLEPHEIAEKLGITKRTVYRLLEEYKDDASLDEDLP